MTCPLCGQRKARRSCPGVGQQICTICCGTKRLVEIKCPADCPYLATAREHPPAIQQREQQRDVGAFMLTLEGLTERQQQVLFLLLGIVRRQQDDPLRRLVDADVAEAARALAATMETAARGVIYEHQPATMPAQRLVTDIKALFDEIGSRGGAKMVERDGPVILRAMERGATETTRLLPGGERAFLELVARVLRPTAASQAEDESSRVSAPPPPGAGSGLILPPD